MPDSKNGRRTEQAKANLDPTSGPTSGTRVDFHAVPVQNTKPFKPWKYPPKKIHFRAENTEKKTPKNSDKIWKNTNLGDFHIFFLFWSVFSILKCILGSIFGIWVRNSFAPYRGQIPQNREKRVSESKKPPFPTTPEKGVLSQKIPIFLVVLCIEMGIFWLRAPFSGVVGNGGFWLRNPLFLILGILTPVRGEQIPKIWGVLYSVWGTHDPKTRVAFPCFGPSRTPHESSHETSHEGVTKVPTKVSAQVVEAHLSYFHLFLGILQKGSPERCRFRFFPFSSVFFRFFPFPFFPFWLFFGGSNFFRVFPFSSVSLDGDNGVLVIGFRFPWRR